MGKMNERDQNDTYYSRIVVEDKERRGSAKRATIKEVILISKDLDDVYVLP
jgi:hypothetical protein